MAGNTLYVYADFHAPAMAAIDAAVRRFGGNDKLRLDLVLVVNVLPAEAVAVLFLNGGRDQNLVAFRNQAEVLHDLCAVHGGNHAALLVGTAAPVDDVVGFIAFVGILFPVADVADADGVDVSVKRDDFIAGAHPAEGVSFGVDFGLVKAERFHLFDGALDDAFLFTAFAGNRDEIAEEFCHLFFISLRRLFDLAVIHGASIFLSSAVAGAAACGRGQSFFASM
ncbi:hypothetical protein SDC9_152880 [bioreactor metagenome]|uniref:Uncharacterized protein n=1 Tax=bioreactor metagenome TaxID=1076179 RepID=A0A645EWP7_9ZZZZ